jgi:hypothetical protein
MCPWLREVGSDFRCDLRQRRTFEKVDIDRDIPRWCPIQNGVFVTTNRQENREALERLKRDKARG